MKSILKNLNNNTNITKLHLISLINYLTMWSGLFGSVTIEEDIKKTIFRNALNSNTYNVTNTLTKNNINVINSNLVDECGQNLLHIASRTKNHDLAKYLVEKNIDKSKKNMFNETPLDIAIKNHDLKMIEIILERDTTTYYRDETGRLTSRISDLETNNKKLIDTNKELTLKNSTLHVELAEERRIKKRKVDDYEICFTENKRLRSEVSQLKLDNKTLEQTVTTLRDSMKKR